MYSAPILMSVNLATLAALEPCVRTRTAGTSAPVRLVTRAIRVSPVRTSTSALRQQTAPRISYRRAAGAPSATTCPGASDANARPASRATRSSLAKVRALCSYHSGQRDKMAPFSHNSREKTCEALSQGRLTQSRDNRLFRFASRFSHLRSSSFTFVT